MKKLLLLQKFKTEDLNEIISSLSDKYEIIIPTNYDEIELSEKIQNVEIAIGSKISLNLLGKASKLEIIQSPGTGVDGFPLIELKKRNIKLCNSHSHSKYVAEFAVSMLMSLIKKLHLHDKFMRDGVWWRPKNAENDSLYLSGTLIGKTVGFVGFGNIGQYIAKLLSGFDINVIASDLSQTIMHESIKSFTKFENLENVVKTSDYIFVTVPLTSNTKDLINESVLKLASKKSLWVHISRGPVINEKAIFEALSENKIGGIAIDNWFGAMKKVDDKTFPSENFDFHKLDNVLLSPYRALYISESSPHIIDVIENLKKFATEEKLSNVVDYNKGF